MQRLLVSAVCVCARARRGRKNRGAAGQRVLGFLQARLESVLQAQGDYDFIVNGRFKGGYITRQYGDPGKGIDAGKR